MIEVCCALIIRDGKVLATQRSEEMPHPLKWEFPGGKVKMGESPERCIMREIKEELRIQIKVDQMLPSVTHSYENFTIKLIPFLCSILKGTVYLSEHLHFDWVDFNDLDTIDWLDADRKLVEKIQEKSSSFL